MTNELGIELKCENCERCCEMSIIHSQRKFVRGVCLKNKKVFFKPLKFKFLWVEKLFDESLKIVERILKNSEANLKKRRNNEQ